MKTSYYVIDGLNQKFNSLFDVRSHFEMYSDNDKKEMDCTPIYGYDKSGNETTTRWYHYRKNGKVVLSKN